MSADDQSDAGSGEKTVTKTRSFKAEGLQTARPIVSAIGASWEDFFDAAGIDLPERDQPEPQEREVSFGNPDLKDDKVVTRV